MITPSGLSVFFGPEILLITLSGETFGKLYGGAGGNYIYKSGALYKIQTSGVTVLLDGYVGGITNIVQNLSVNTLIGTPYYPQQRFYYHPSLNEINANWTRSSISPSGVCTDLLSDDGDDLSIVPILTGNSNILGNRIDKLVIPDSFYDSDVGIPQGVQIALITDLEAAI